MVSTIIIDTIFPSTAQFFFFFAFLTFTFCKTTCELWSLLFHFFLMTAWVIRAEMSSFLKIKKRFSTKRNRVSYKLLAREMPSFPNIITSTDKLGKDFALLNPRGYVLKRQPKHIWLSFWSHVAIRQTGLNSTVSCVTNLAVDFSREHTPQLANAYALNSESALN